MLHLNIAHVCEKFGKDRPNIKNVMAIFRIARRTIRVLQRPPTITVPPNPDTIKHWMLCSRFICESPVLAVANMCNTSMI